MRLTVEFKSYKKGERGKYQLVVGKNKLETLKAKLKELTRKTNPMSLDERIQRLNWLIRGWVNYFKLASIQAKLKALDEWLRNEERIHEDKLKKTKPS